MENKIPLEETTGYALALAFKPFIPEKMSEKDAMLTVGDFGKAINNAFLNDKSNRIRSLKNLLLDICKFQNGETITLSGLTFKKDVNENSFYKQIELLTNIV